MYRSVVAFLILNTFYYSFGYPLELNETLGKSLQLLADNCDNKFLSIQIKNHIESCDITLSSERKIKETELECLLFYDMNNQLCTALQGSKLDLNETYNLEVNQTQKVDLTCDEASKNWKFTNLTPFPKYYNTSLKVLKTLAICLRACAVEDNWSEDTNFFCKYYQWGTKLLQQLSTGDIVNRGSDSANPPKPNTQTNTPAKFVPTASSSPLAQNSPKVPSTNEQTQLENALEQAQLEIPKFPVQTDLGNSGYEQVALNDAQLNNEHPKKSDLKIIKENQQTIETHAASTAINNTGQPLGSNDLPIGNKVDKIQIPKKDKEEQSADAVDDDGDVYDSGDPLDDAQLPPASSNDDNDPNVETGSKQKDKKNLHKNVESIMSSLDVPGSQKDIYSNTMSDQFGEVDDHFFSFFLTATILVIFFYVLYHNKSKFRKVFLGLLVEGRQPGRRRNSRGHEYRRLDTLEQAMSTNSTAPPSKIIY